MKNYLMKGLLALVAGGFAASCADHDVDYVPLAQQKSQAYVQAFKDLIGGEVDPNQNWGFEVLTVPSEGEEAVARARTRAVTRTPAEFGWEISSDYNATFKKAYYDEIVAALPEQQKATNKLNDYEFVSRGLIEFSILYSQTSASDIIGYYYYQPSAGISSRTEVQFVDNINNIKNYTQYYLNNTWNNVDQWNGPKFATEWGASEIRAKTFTINIPAGYRVGFYIINGSNKMYSNKSLNSDGAFYSAIARLSDGSYAVGLEDWWNQYGDSDFDCNDVVMAVARNSTIPTIINNNDNNSDDNNDDDTPDTPVIDTPSGPTSQPTTTTITEQVIKRKRLAIQGRVFCEDLGKAGNKDIDFNDIVFDARIWRTYEFDRVTTNGSVAEGENRNSKWDAEICLLAAGGTIASKLADNDVHNLFNVGQTTMVNTVDDHADQLTYWENSSIERDPVTFHYDMTSIIDGTGYASLNLIPIEVMWIMDKENPSSDYGTMQSVGQLSANLGETPHKITLPIGTVWPSERKSITEAYPAFADWAKNKDNYPEFYNAYVSSHLYTGKTEGLDTADGNGNAYYVVNDNDLYTNYWADEVLSSSSYTITETPLWDEGMEFGGSSQGSNIYASFDIPVGSTLRIYATSSTPSDNYLQLALIDDQSGAWPNDRMIYDRQNVDLSAGYVDIVVTQNIKNNMTGAGIKQNYFGLWGKNCNVTKIVYRVTD